MAGESIVARQLPVSLKDINTSAGTWTYTESSGQVTLDKTAADNTPIITFPLLIPRRNDQFGVRLKSIIIPYRNTTTNLDAEITASIVRNEYDAVVTGATGDIAVATVASTHDGSVTADANDRRMVITVTSPDWDYATEALCVYVAKITIDAAAGSVLRLGFPVVVYDELV